MKFILGSIFGFSLGIVISLSKPIKPHFCYEPNNLSPSIIIARSNSNRPLHKDNDPDQHGGMFDPKIGLMRRVGYIYHRGCYEGRIFKTEFDAGRCPTRL